MIMNQGLGKEWFTREQGAWLLPPPEDVDEYLPVRVVASLMIGEHPIRTWVGDVPNASEAHAMGEQMFQFGYDVTMNGITRMFAKHIIVQVSYTNMMEAD